MILHEQILQPPEGVSIPWVSLHVESLSLAHCEPSGSVITITSVHPFAGTITNAVDPTPDVLFAIADDIRRQIPGLRTRITTLPTSHPALGTSHYLLVNSFDGTTPAILHTQDPVALYLADESGTLAPAAFFRTSTDISAEGWAYWWEDAQRAFHKLTIGFMTECGIPVPAAIADAVKHD